MARLSWSDVALFAALCALTPFAIWWNGVAVVYLWSWFVEPLGAVALKGPWHAAGLLLMASLPMQGVAKKAGNPEDDRVDTVFKFAMLSASVPALALVLGLLFRWGMAA